jgi:hypothetical protein
MSRGNGALRGGWNFYTLHVSADGKTLTVSFRSDAAFPQLPLHAYASENWARLAHDVGTAFIVASFSGQIYLRLIPGNQWMLKTMFAGYEARA